MQMINRAGRIVPGNPVGDERGGLSVIGASQDSNTGGNLNNRPLAHADHINALSAQLRIVPGIAG
jgi:hypothetical protein